MVKRFLKSFFMHWHHWKAVPHRYEYALHCSCGVKVMMHLGEIVAKGAAKISNGKARERRWKYIREGVLQKMASQG